MKKTIQMLCTCVPIAIGMVACGGGGGDTTPEAVVTSVLPAQVLRSASNTVSLSFTIQLNKPVVRGLSVAYSTASTSTSTAGVSLGSAVGGTCGTAGVDYQAPGNNAIVSLPAGASTGQILVGVCSLATFKPNLTLKLQWGSGPAAGVVQGLIVNTAAGGVTSSGAATQMGGAPSNGRDTNPLTNSDADGAAGLSYAKLPSSSNWQCTQDNVTGLLWNSGDQSASSGYSQLASYVAQVNLAAPCGQNNWRLPTVNELLSIVNFGSASGVASDSRFFPQTATRYWSADAVAGASANAWFVDFGNQGVVSFDNTTTPVNASYRVLLVSGALNVAAPCNATDLQYVDNLDGTVSNSSTGLMWKQCEEGAALPGCTGTKTAFTSANQVLNQISNDNAAGAAAGLGYTDWRLPSVKELASLVNRSCTGTPINALAFPNTDQLSNLSATFFAPNTTRLWVVDFADGSTSPVDPATSGGRPIRLVRAGQ